MTGLDHSESRADSKGTGTAYLGGAVAIIGLSIVILGNASEWFDYLSGVVFVCLAGTLAYQGIQSIAQGRRTAGENQSHQ